MTTNAASTTVASPLLEMRDAFAPPALCAAVWHSCTAQRWYFGNQSDATQGGLPFWKMDLDGVPALDALWQFARPLCESAAGHPLRVVRQYANGHTYGLGGQAHTDDSRPGCFTLLYYPMPEWHPQWEGETFFYATTGEVISAIVPRPNRAVFFDSRIPHAGRAPARACPALRVTVAFKLEPV